MSNVVDKAKSFLMYKELDERVDHICARMMVRVRAYKEALKDMPGDYMVTTNLGARHLFNVDKNIGLMPRPLLFAVLRREIQRLEAECGYADFNFGKGIIGYLEPYDYTLLEEHRGDEEFIRQIVEFEVVPMLIYVSCYGEACSIKLGGKAITQLQEWWEKEREIVLNHLLPDG